jgi:uncharacterized protein
LNAWACAALSARTLVEAAVRAGAKAVALDVFGDTDTRAAATHWQAIGSSARCQIEPELFLRSLHGLAHTGRADAWVYGSGFEGLADLVQAAEAVLPLIGTPAHALRRVRCPTEFFGLLDAQKLAHPDVLFSHCPSGWLHKAAGACGGTHIRRAAADESLAPGFYAQREVAGRTLSASYLANGRAARLLGVHEQTVQPLGERPFVFSGVVGPLKHTLTRPQLSEIERALQVLTAEFGLRGLGSLDFMHKGDELWLLEVNPRPSASLPLYDHDRLPLLRAHQLACQGADLATLVMFTPKPLVHGSCTVYARQRLHIGPQHAAALQTWPHVHDRPTLGSLFESGQPLCSVSASAGQAHAAHAQLAARSAGLLETLESIA